MSRGPRLTNFGLTELMLVMAIVGVLWVVASGC